MSSAIGYRQHAHPHAQLAYWLDQVRGYDRTKQADAAAPAGDDMPFEQAFSSLAHASLRARAPGLLEYEAGFQLVDRAEDNSKAIGIFGFKVGSQWLYAPVFFVGGDLKGHELLYVKNQDSFVPLKENWVNYLINKRPMTLGEGVNRDTRRLGVRSPDYAQIARSPAKFAAAREFPAAFRAALPGLAYAATSDPYTDPRYAGMADLPAVLRSGGVKLAAALGAYCEGYPQLAAALDTLYGPEVVAALDEVKRASLFEAERDSVLARPRSRPAAPAARPRRLGVTGSALAPTGRAHPIKSGSLQVYTYDAGDDAKVRTIPDRDAARLRRDSVLIKDERDDDEVATAFHVRVRRELTNPTETGLYEVLLKPGEFARCVVIYGPHGPNGRRSWATVARVDGTKSWMNLNPGYIWVSKQYSGEDYAEWARSLPVADKFADDDEGQYILVGVDRPDGTLPLIVEGAIGASGPDDYKLYNVRFDMYAERPRQAYMRGMGQKGYLAHELAGDDEKYDRWSNGERVALGMRGAKLRSKFGDLFVPADYRKFKVENADYDDDQWDVPKFDPDKPDREIKSLTGGKGQSQTQLMPTGGIVDPELELYEKYSALAPELRVQATGADRFELNGRGPYDRRATKIALVVDHAFREDVADLMLQEAEAERRSIGRGPATYRVVYPDYVKAAVGPGDMPYGQAGLGPGPGGPGFPDPAMATGSFMSPDIPTQLPQELLQPVSGMGELPGARESQRPNAPVVPDPSAAGAAAAAAQSGQKEIFDTSMIGGLLKSTGDDHLVDKHLGDLMKGLDRCGRLLFVMYWHHDRFAERYGKQALPELEEALRNSFDDLGDLVLFLKQKTIEADPIAALSHIDLKDQGN